MRTERKRELNFQNAHHAQTRAQLWSTQDGAHDDVSEQNEHRAEAGATFSIKMCTARRREAQKCSNGAAEVLPLLRRAPYNSQFGPA